MSAKLKYICGHCGTLYANKCLCICGKKTVKISTLSHAQSADGSGCQTIAGTEDASAGRG